MRKTLLASAALIVMGGGAYAEVSVTGAGNFGVKFDGSKSGSEALTFHHEFDVKFTASGTTDGGLTFGGSVGIDDRESGSGTADLAKITKTLGRPLDYQVTPGTKAEDVCYISHQNGTGEMAALYTKNDEVYTRTKDLGGTFQYLRDNGLVAADKVPNVDAGPIALKTFSNCSDVTYTQYLVDVGGEAETKSTTANNASVHIGFDVHTLTIGDGLDAGDVAAGGVNDVGFDGIGVDDVAEKLRGGTNVDVVYTGSFGVANVRVSSGGDDNWGVGFNFNVAPVTIGVGFDSKKVASIGLGLAQGPVSGKLLYSTASEDDKKAYGAEIGYTISEGTSVTIVYSQLKDPMGGADEDAVGFGFSHGLGGGATLAAGIGQVNDETKADLGITMAF